MYNILKIPFDFFYQDSIFNCSYKRINELSKVYDELSVTQRLNFVAKASLRCAIRTGVVTGIACFFYNRIVSEKQNLGFNWRQCVTDSISSSFFSREALRIGICFFYHICIDNFKLSTYGDRKQSEVFGESANIPIRIATIQTLTTYIPPLIWKQPIDASLHLNWLASCLYPTDISMFLISRQIMVGFTADAATRLFLLCLKKKVS